MAKASEIMLDETIPHGTREGFAQGCHGSHCPGKDSLGMSCSQANIRYASDYSYKRRIDGGLSPEAIAAEDALDGFVAPSAASRRADVQPVPSVTMADSTESITVSAAALLRAKRESEGRVLREVDDVDDLDVPLAGGPSGEVSDEPKRKGRPPSPHGTNTRWNNGCREDCPGGEDGTTCEQAHESWLAAKRGEVPTEAGEVEPSEEPVDPERSPAYDGSTFSVDDPPVDAVADERGEGDAIDRLRQAAENADAQRDAVLEANAAMVGRINELESLLSDSVILNADLVQKVAELEAKLGEAYRESMDWQQRRDAESIARSAAEGTVARLQEQLVSSALELDVAKSPASAPASALAAMSFAIEQVGSTLRVQMDGSSEPMRLELGFENGRLQRAAVVTGA